MHVDVIREKTLKIILVLSAAVVLLAGLFLSMKGFPGHADFRAWLERQLTRTVPLPGGSDPADTIVYVLGGTQRSLQDKFATAAFLVRSGCAGKILFLNQPGSTQYDRELGRNLTNEEWARRTLAGFGVDPAAIEPVSLSEKGMFGTLSEAQSLAETAARRGYTRVILVTSPYHTRRTWLTFSAMFPKNRETGLSLYASQNGARLRDLLFEFCKLQFYAGILLPLTSGETGNFARPASSGQFMQHSAAR